MYKYANSHNVYNYATQSAPFILLQRSLGDFRRFELAGNQALALGCTVVNFLNQTGAKGSIAGAELITKDEAKGIKNQIMTGSYLRPFTVEFTASLKF